jgi:hypothetical protein
LESQKPVVESQKSEVGSQKPEVKFRKEIGPPQAQQKRGAISVKPGLGAG